MQSRALLSKIGLVLCVISFVVQMLGITCPAWLVVTIDLVVLGGLSGGSFTGFGTILTQSAVWYVRVCVDGSDYSSCAFGQHNAREMGFKIGHALSDLADLNWMEIEAELTLALLFCMVGGIIVAISLYTKKVSAKLMLAFASACMFISGVLIIPAVLTVGLSIQKTKTAVALIAEGTDVMSVLAPWALALSAAGLILAFIASVLLLVATCKSPVQASAVITPEVNHLPEAILKMGSFPLNVARISVSDMGGHVPPTLPPRMTFVSDGLPAIGAHDEEPLEFEQRGLIREDTFGPGFLHPPHFGLNGGHPFVLGETITEMSTPPSYTRVRSSLDKTENDVWQNNTNIDPDDVDVSTRSRSSSAEQSIATLTHNNTNSSWLWRSPKVDSKTHSVKRQLQLQSNTRSRSQTSEKTRFSKNEKTKATRGHTNVKTKSDGLEHV